MTNPTANRSYDMPQSSDLVTNLPADFATFGDAVDLDMVTDGGYATTVTSASPITLTKTSARVQFLTGSTAQDVILPVVTTLALGNRWRIVNKSSNTVTVKSSGSNTIYAIPTGATATFVCILITGTTAASWDYYWDGASAAPTSGGMTLIASGTLSGASVTISSIPQTYKYLVLVFNEFTNATADGFFRIDANGAGGIARHCGVISSGTFNRDAVILQTPNTYDRTNADNGSFIEIHNYTAANNYNKSFVWAGNYYAGAIGMVSGGIVSATAGAITSIVLSNTGGNWSSGDYYVYGVS